MRGQWAGEPGKAAPAAQTRVALGMNPGCAGGCEYIQFFTRTGVLMHPYAHLRYTYRPSRFETPRWLRRVWAWF